MRCSPISHVYLTVNYINSAIHACLETRAVFAAKLALDKEVARLNATRWRANFIFRKSS